eukprot:COSAG04_NODE_804_length_10157_cov_2.622688_2_plen_375_part_00
MLVGPEPRASAAASPSNVTATIRRFGCALNLGGFVLGNASANIGDVATAADAMRQHGYWQMPVALASSVSHATKLAAVDVSLPAVRLPTYPSKTGNAEGWGSEALKWLGELSWATTNSSNKMAMVVALDACEGSDSLVRFGAYSSMIFGAQMLWWEGMDRCARIGSGRFELVASINRHIAQWAEPLFLKPVRFRIAEAWSTSTVAIPTLPTVIGKPPNAQPAHITAGKPGATPSSLIQTMDDDLLVLHLVNISTVQDGLGPPPGFRTPNEQRHFLLVLSTSLSAKDGGAPIRQLNLTLRHDIRSVRPIEPDALQGFADVPNPPNQLGTDAHYYPPNFKGTAGCQLRWLGPRAPLQLPGALRVQPAHHLLISEVF